MDNQLRTFSYGGGVQSTAALVLAAQGKIDFPTFLFCNVGEDSENPATLEYVSQYAKPYADANGVELVELQRKRRDGTTETVLGRTLGKTRSIPIPMRGANGAPQYRRNCTSDFKIKVVAKWLRQHGATAETPAVTGLGISLDESQRARSNSGFPYQVLAYPLIDLHLTRRDCVSIIERAGLPVPPKSSCYFCPFKAPSDWQRLKREQPELFERSAEIERAINEKRRDQVLGRADNMWLSRFAKPLDEAIGDQMYMDDLFDNCESGYCMT